MVIALPVYRDRNALLARPQSDSWVDIDDIEFVILGNSPRVDDAAQPREPVDADPVTEPGECLRAVHDLAMSRRITPTTPKERVVVLSGEAMVEAENAKVSLKRMQWFDVPASGATISNAVQPGADGFRPIVEIARISGHWREVIRTAIFSFGPGRPCDYHYHDGDEYWFVFRGHFTLHFRGADHQMGPGSILAAGFGEEHGVIDPSETFEGVGFATQLEGQCRDGHLWRNEHGIPVAIRQNGPH